MAEAAVFFTLTPREILLRLTAFRRARLRRQEELWLLGQYVALAVHAPAHLPPLPPGLWRKRAHDRRRNEAAAAWLARNG